MIIVSPYTAGRLDQHYSNSETFLPQRWMRAEENLRNHPFAFVPFASGARSCIGRKLAEGEIILCLANVGIAFDYFWFCLIKSASSQWSKLMILFHCPKLMKHFKIELLNEKEIGIRLVMITAPDQEVKIRLRPRLS